MGYGICAFGAEMGWGTFGPDIGYWIYASKLAGYGEIQETGDRRRRTGGGRLRRGYGICARCAGWICDSGAAWIWDMRRYAAEYAGLRLWIYEVAQGLGCGVVV